MQRPDMKKNREKEYEMRVSQIEEKVMSEGQMNQHPASCLTGHDNVTSPVPVCVLGFFRNSLSITQTNVFRIRSKIYSYHFI